MVPESEPSPENECDNDGYHSGARVGRFTLVARLASGGMAHVWTAEPDKGSGLGRTVALKLMRPELAQERDYVRMFIDEATIASAIEHPNVCQIYDYEHHGKTLFIAMEWIPGDSLAGMLRLPDRFVPLDAATAARICADACAGLHAAHEVLDEHGTPLGVIHRDISLPNILVSLQGQVKVTDFGVAKASRQLHDRTKTGVVKGKFGYLAPEQISGTKIDRRVDIYAMGCVLYIATVGLRPFGNGPEAMAKILRGTYRKPRDVDALFPMGLEKIIAKALQHKPNDRYATAEDMRNALEQWLMDVRAVVTPADIAQELEVRMRPEARALVEKLRLHRRTANHADALLDAFDENEPPTASSGIVVPPGALRQQSEKVRPHHWSDPAESQAPSKDAPPKARTSGEEEDPSGWRKTHEQHLEEGITDAVKAQGLSPEDSSPEQLNKSPASTPPEELEEHSGLLLQAAAVGVMVALIAWLLLR